MLTPQVQDKTVHLIRMKWDAKYRAKFEALEADLAQAQAILKARQQSVDVAKGTYHGTRPGDVTKDCSPELQGLAALLATIEFIDPAQRLQMLKEWANT